MPTLSKRILRALSSLGLTHTLILTGAASAAFAAPTPPASEGASAQLLSGEPGLWLPERGPLGRQPLQWLGRAGDKALYALGGGALYRAEDRELTGPQRAVTSWQLAGHYAPLIEWDEGEGVSASGPFSPELLSELERAVGLMIEEEVEGLGDDAWLSEDSASFILESYMNEEDPPLDSPFRVSGLYPNDAGVWIGTGAGVWGSNEDSLIPLGGSPSGVRGLTQAFGALWASTHDALWTWSGQEGEAWERFEGSQGGSKLASHQGSLWLLSGEELLKLNSSRGSLHRAHSPEDSLVDIFEGGGELWLLTTRQLWRKRGELWAPCLRFPISPTHARYSEGSLVIVSREHLWVGDASCTQSRVIHRPQVEGVGFRDAIFAHGKLYAATSQGLFQWRATREISPGGFELLYLKRALASLPSFDELYLAALEESQLDPRATSFGTRPVLSALLPELRAQLRYDPSRDDEVPTFSDGNRQLTLLQPVPTYQVMLEWDLSFDFLARLFNPELGAAYTELQSQMEQSLDQPGVDVALEAELGAPDDWSDDTYTTQAQRLAATSVALQRRQAHKDRSQLRKYMLRLYREWLDLIYRQWLAPSAPTGEEALDDKLRSQELSALLNALTGYRFKLKVPRRKGPR